ncbi:hypothetical protein HUJ04_011129 [Dendroctonus ponderosae]|nr:hypothetical protein HUJ04_011129 [Dendroctonus ponderosae]KAH1028399.1 hypothetical protein HUJ05_001753 [Dendroctonus ponderosae]
MCEIQCQTKVIFFNPGVVALKVDYEKEQQRLMRPWEEVDPDETLINSDQDEDVVEYRSEGSDTVQEDDSSDDDRSPAKSPLGCWNLFINDEILDINVELTNFYIATKTPQNYKRDRDCILSATDEIEIKALIGLLYLSGLLKISELSIDEI